MSLVIPNPKPITFYYSVPDICTVEAFVTYMGVNIYALVPSSAVEKGAYKVEWNGKDSGGNYAKEGSYNYIFSAVTPKTTFTKKGIVRIDNTKPYASQITISPSEESIAQLNNNTMTNDLTLSYYLSEKCYVTVDILNASGGVASNVMLSQLQEAKARSISFSKGELMNSGIFEPGEYSIRLKLVDEAGNEETISKAKFTILSGLSISSATASPAIFTPNGDNHDDFVTFKYKVSGGVGDITATVKIKSLAGATVKTFTDTVHGTLSTVSLIWYGNDEQNNMCPDGQYQYEISAADSAGDAPSPITGNLVLVRNPTIVTYADPKNISPNGDGLADETTISYNIDYQGQLITGNSQITSTIYDQAGTKVHYFSDSKGEGNYSHKWAGENDQTGGIVANGKYRMEVWASDPTGTIYAYSADIVVGAELSITGESAAPVIFTPNGDGHDDITTIGYFVSGGVGSIVSTVEIKTLAGTTVKTFTGSGITPPNTCSFAWDGKDEANNLCADGEYKYEITAADSIGNLSSKVTGSVVLAANTAISVYADPKALSPNGDGIDDISTIYCVISYGGLISGDSQIAMDIFDQSGTKVYSLTDSMSEGSYTYVWGGENNQAGGFVRDGTYTLETHAVDPTGTVYSYTADLVVSAELSITGESIAPAIFTPNADAHDDHTTISYSVSGGVGDITATIKIKPLTGATVKTFTSHLTSPVSDLVIWDGKDEANNMCPDGKYKCEISASDIAGNVTSETVEDITLVNTPTITLNAAPTEFSPDGDGVDENAVISYSIDYKGGLIDGDSQIVVNIYDQSGPKVYYFADTKTEGSYSHSWGGQNNQIGGKVLDGTYKLEVQATDPTGTVYQYTADLIIDRGPPNIIDKGPSQPMITPNGDGQYDDTTIKYEVDEVGNPISSVEVRIYNSKTKFDSTTLVRTLLGAVDGDTLWDGKVNTVGGNGDTDGNGYADKGMYKYVIEASDVLGNTVTHVSTFEMQVDKVYLSFGQITSNPTNQYFSPNGDGVKDSTIISFKLETTQEVSPYYLQAKGKKIAGMKIMSGYNVGKVTMKIKDMSGNTKRTLMDSVTCEAGITYEVTWDGKDASGSLVSDGSYTIEVTAVNLIGDPASNNLFLPCVVDTVCPVVGITSPDADSWNKETIDIYGTASDANDINYSLGYGGSSNNLGSGNTSKTNEKIASWNTTFEADGTYIVKLIAYDSAGNTAEAQRSFGVDNTLPTIEITSPIAGTYLDFPLEVIGSAVDLSAGIDKYDIKIQNAMVGVSWTKIYSGTEEVYNSVLGLVNTINLNGNFRLKVIAYDNAGNSCEANSASFQLTNVKKLTKSPSASNWAPCISPDGTKIVYCSNYGGYTNLWTVNIEAMTGNKLSNSLSVWNGFYNPIFANDAEILFDGYVTNFGLHVIGLNGNEIRSLNPAHWYLYSYSPAASAIIVKHYKTFFSTDGPPPPPYTCLEKQSYSGGSVTEIVTSNDIGGGSTDIFYEFSWSPNGNKVAFGSQTGLYVCNSDGSSRARITTDNARDLSWSPDGNYIAYSLGNNIKRINSGGGGVITLVSNGYVNIWPRWMPNNKILYVSNASGDNALWMMDSGGGNKQNLTLGYQVCTSEYDSSRSLPYWSNDCSRIVFATGSGSPSDIYLLNLTATTELGGIGIMSVPGLSGPIVILSTSSTPELISPVGGTTVKTLRPTFKWYGVQNIKDYRIECATTSDADALSSSMDNYTTTISDVSSAQPICEFTQNEHFMGLDENTPGDPYWYWRVQTVTTEATTSEVGSFKIELPSSVSGVTNWPNPFDPKKERTKIRYKLGREPNSVTIRIYDITGALVRELGGTTNPEGGSVGNKYNDVEWDGRNGRGDMVLNGVYPFEVTVSYGDKSVTGRGKAVVLK